MVSVRLSRFSPRASSLGSSGEVLSDLGRVKALHLEVRAKHCLARTELSGRAYQGFRAAGVVVPPRVVGL